MSLSPNDKQLESTVADNEKETHDTHEDAVEKQDDVESTDEGPSEDGLVEKEEIGGGSHEEDDEEEDDEEDEEEDEEPALKYERISGNLPDIFKKDSGSAIAITKKHMVGASFPPNEPVDQCYLFRFSGLMQASSTFSISLESESSPSNLIQLLWWT